MSTLQRIWITALTVLALGVAKASAGQPPQYEVTGFPISPLQILVLGSSVIQEQPSIPTLTLDGMPASTHQIAVIAPRTKQQIAESDEWWLAQLHGAPRLARLGSRNR
jgi:hypothetical protein